MAASANAGAELAMIGTSANLATTSVAAEAIRRVPLAQDASFQAGVRSLRELSADKQWVLLVQPDVVLDDDCVAAFAAAATESDTVGVLYSDNDYRDDKGCRFHPSMRSRFSIQRLKSEDWLGAVIAVRSDLLQLPHLDESTGELSYTLSLEIAGTLGTPEFVHVPQVLYSLCSTPKRLTRRSLRSRVPVGGTGELTTVIIPTHNRGDLLKRCVDSILERTSSRRPEIIIYDNNSDDEGTRRLLQQYAGRDGFQVLRDELPFNYSRMNNEAAAVAAGEVLIFLNNDTEVVSGDWLARLTSIAGEPDVGCAGPLLLTLSGTIQHAGLVTGPGGVAAHVHQGLRCRDIDETVPIVTRDVSAVTGACMAIEKRKFLDAAGFDAAGLPVAFNDVDLCLRLERQGLRNVFVADVTLIHVGSATRAPDDFMRGSERFRAEFRLMRERWGPRLDFDPFFPEQMRMTRAGPQLRLA